MTNFTIAAAEVTVAGATTTAIATSANLDAFYTALIGFGIALVTVVGGELIKFLVAFLKKKTEDLQSHDNSSDNPTDK